MKYRALLHRFGSPMFAHCFSRSSRPFSRRNQAELAVERLEDRLALATDFGDAPFLVLLSDDGARHEAIGPQLGTQRDTELDGTPSALADGDDNNADDENGVQFVEGFRQGESAEIIVMVENAATGAKLDAWIDLNQDQDWDDPGEQVLVSLDVVEGENTFSLAIPDTALVGQTYARFRLSSAGGLNPTGAALDGEVEDYHIFIAPDRASTSLRTGTLDTTHYIPPFFGVAGLDQHVLWLSTPEIDPVHVTISNAEGTVNHTVQISRSSPVELDLSQPDLGLGADTSGLSIGSGVNSLGLVAESGLNQVNSSDGLILTGDAAFYANIRHSDPAQGASLTAKGQTAFGTEFRSGHLNTSPDSTNANLRSHFISVIATEDNTTVTFELPPHIVFANGTGTFTGSTVTSPVLQQGESYVVGVRFTDNLGSVLNDLNGTRITSDRPIVVNSGSWLAGNGVGQDIGIDQLLPTSQLGTEYILAKGQAVLEANALETPIVIANFDNTQVFVNGSSTPLATLNAGEYLVVSGSNFTASNTLYVQTTQPVSVFQTTAGADSSANIGLNFVVPLNDAILPQEVVIPQVDELGTATLRIVAPVGAEVFLDGNLLVNPQAVQGVAGLELYTVTDTGDAVITSDEPLYVSLTTVSGARTTAAYFSGVPNTIATSDESFVATGGTILVDVQANDLSVGQTFQVLEVSDAPNGTTVLNSDGTITYTPDEGFIGTDTFAYRVESSDTTITDYGTVTIQVLPNTFAFTTNLFSAVEGDTSDTIEVVTVRREGVLDRVATVDVSIFSSNQNPAADASDFTTEVVTVSFGIGQQEVTVPVEVFGDFVLEPDEFIALALQGSAVSPDQPTTVLVLLNDEATLQSDTSTVDEDQSVIVDVFVNDLDIVPGELPVLLVDPLHGTAMVNPDGTIQYTPNPQFSGVDTLTYAVAEPGNPSATLTITISPVVDDPGLTTTAVTGLGKEPLPVEILIAGSPDTDGSETLGNLVVANLPTAITFSAGFQTTAGWEIPLAELENLTVTSSVAGSFVLALELTNTDGTTEQVFQASLEIESQLVLFPNTVLSSTVPTLINPTTQQVPRVSLLSSPAANGFSLSRSEGFSDGISFLLSNPSSDVLSDDFFSELGLLETELQNNELPFPSTIRSVPEVELSQPQLLSELREASPEVTEVSAEDQPVTESEAVAPVQVPVLVQPSEAPSNDPSDQTPQIVNESPAVIAQVPASQPSDGNAGGGGAIQEPLAQQEVTVPKIAPNSEPDGTIAEIEEQLAEKPRGTIPTILALMALLYGTQQNRTGLRLRGRRHRNPAK